MGYAAKPAGTDSRPFGGPGVPSHTFRLQAYAGGAMWLSRARHPAPPGTYGAHAFQAFGEIGYRLTPDGLAVEPFAGLMWPHLSTVAFAETGGSAALDASRGMMSNAAATLARDSFMVEAGLDMRLGERTSLGIDYGGRFATGAGDHALRGKIGWKIN